MKIEQTPHLIGSITIPPNVKTESAAWRLLDRATNNDPYCNNFRIAAYDDAQQMELYRAKQEDGCCGSVDILVIINGTPTMIGCNYGH
tara:strand:+ start:596 stop:859 length:264 start_codon:yes stop_codon:yes gene_type:complete